MRTRIKVIFVTVPLLASCANSPSEYYSSLPRCGGVEPRPDSVSVKACIAVPQVREYLNSVHQELIDAWRIHRDIPPDQRITLMFRLAPDGSLQCLSLPPGPGLTLAPSIIAAFQRASPFPPLSPEMNCLSLIPITATFSNPRADS